MLLEIGTLLGEEYILHIYVQDEYNILSIYFEFLFYFLITSLIKNGSDRHYAALRKKKCIPLFNLTNSIQKLYPYLRFCCMPPDVST